MWYIVRLDSSRVATLVKVRSATRVSSSDPTSRSRTIYQYILRFCGKSNAAREIPYTTTVSSLCTNGVLFPQYPARAGVPSSIRGFTSTFRTLPNILCGLRKQAPQSAKSPNKITIMNIYQIPGIHRTNQTIALYDNIILRPLSPSARDKLTNVPRHRRSRHQSWRELHNDTRLLDNPNPPTVDHNY